MIVKLIMALAVAYAGWWLWQGPKHRWKASTAPRSGLPAAPLDRERQAALAVLGLAPGASPDDVRAAHRRLLRTVHPDLGGSAELARQVNAARDTLLDAAD